MHKDDESWVKEQINRIHAPHLKQDAWNGYKRVYASTYDKEPISFRKDNKARRSANTALRLFVNKCVEYERG